jgi:hypothetical protein
MSGDGIKLMLWEFFFVQAADPSASVMVKTMSTHWNPIGRMRLSALFMISTGEPCLLDLPFIFFSLFIGVN